MSRIAFSGLRHLLRRLDFVYKKPKAIALAQQFSFIFFKNE